MGASQIEQSHFRSSLHIIEVEESGGIHITTFTTHRRLARDPLVNARSEADQQVRGSEAIANTPEQGEHIAALLEFFSTRNSPSCDCLMYNLTASGA